MSTMPGGVRVTRADLAELPEDGYRYEIVDGELFVSAAPSYRHQTAVLNVAVLLVRVPVGEVGAPTWSSSASGWSGRAARRTGSSTRWCRG